MFLLRESSRSLLKRSFSKGSRLQTVRILEFEQIDEQVVIKEVPILVDKVRIMSTLLLSAS